MKLVTVYIKNAFTNAEKIFEEQMSGVIQRHKEMNVANPDCFVNFTYDGGKSFICGQPESMKQDEFKIERNEMTFEQYMDKWYYHRRNEKTFQQYTDRANSRA